MKLLLVAVSWQIASDSDKYECLLITSFLFVPATDGLIRGDRRLT